MLIKKNLPLIFAFVILTTALSIQTTEVYAQTGIDPQGIEVSPPSQEITADPGEVVAFDVTVRNTGEIPLPLQVRVDDFTASGDEGQVALTQDGPWSVRSWTQVSPQKLELSPKQEMKVKVTIQVPVQDVGGGKYGAIVFSRQGETIENSAAVSQEVASLFLLKISGPVEEDLRILDFSAPPFVEFGPVPLTLSLENTGNVHVKATGIVSVMNVLGKKVADIVIPPTNVFPLAKRKFTIDFTDRFLIGPYQAVAIVNYGAENKSVTTYTPFFAFPVRLVAGIIIVLALLFFARKRLKKAVRALAGKS